MPWLHWIERFPPNSLSRSILFFTLAGALFGAKLPSVDSIFNSLIDAKSPGAAVLIRQRGRTVVMRGYGVTDLRTFGKIDAHTNFRLASCTKQFTAMAVMLLVHDGKLRYEENLTEIFPGFPAYGRAVTVRHLLTHTSGLSDYETLMEQQQKAGGAAWSATKQIHDEDVLALLAQQDHGDFAPGTSWAYSNSGYVVLGLIVAKVAGMPYAEFLQRRIFKPLKMSRTVAYVRGQNIVRHRAYGYSKNDGRFQESAKGAAARRQTAEEIPSSLGGAADPAPVLREFEDTDQSATSATLGDGGVYSNLLDLARWDEALNTNKLLSKTEMAAALKPVRLNDGTETHWPATSDSDNLAPGKPVAYGFGWFLSPINGQPCMWHTGSTSGFRTVIERFSGGDATTVVVLLNRTDLDPADLAQKALRAEGSYARNEDRRPYHARQITGRRDPFSAGQALISTPLLKMPFLRTPSWGRR